MVDARTKMLDQYRAELARFTDAMVVTCDATRNGLHARPMEVAGRSDKGHIWFITSVDSVTIKDITENSQINLCFQSGQHFMSVSGVARATRDPDRIRELWSVEQSIWFEKGIDDPTLILIEVVPTFAEYWDRSGAQGVRFLLQELAAIATGRTLNEGTGYRKGSIDFTDAVGDDDRAN